MRKVLKLTACLLCFKCQLFAQSQITEANGNVGIGTTNPQAKLHIQGNIYANRPAAMVDWNGHHTIGGSVFFIPSNFGTSYSGYLSLTYPDDNTIRFGTDFDGHLSGNNYRNLQFGRANAPYLTIQDGGNVGIGIPSPHRLLELNSAATYTLRLGNGAANDIFTYDLGRNGSDGLFYFYGNQTSYQGYVFSGINGEYMRIANGGNVGIGTTSPTSKLTVAGDIHARKVKVTVNAGADFVFADDYDLKKLGELQKFIQQHKHLPDIPSAKEMENKGIELGEMNIKLLQKIEELTLYIIELKKENDNQSKKIEQLEVNSQNFKSLQQQIEEIKTRINHQ